MKIAFYIARYTDVDIQIPPSHQCLAAYIVDKGIVREEDLIYAQRIEEILSFEPDVVCVGSVSQTINDAVRISKLVKENLPNCLTIIGGYHISALPETLAQTFDVGIIGEGEVTLAEVLKFYSENKLSKNFKKIKGICYHDGEKIAVNEARELIKNIDELPLPLVRLPKDYNGGAYIFTARGCPYKCCYCASNSFWGNYRFNSAEYIVKFVEFLHEKFNITIFYSIDDLFIAPKSRLLKMRDLLREKGLLGKIKFSGFIRINIFDEEICIALKDMGFDSVRFGYETASERLLNQIKDKPFTTEQVENTIKICNKHNLTVCCSLMFGIPGETREDLEITRNFMLNHKGKLYSSGIYLMQPVPGSKLWNRFSDMFSLDMDFSKFELDMQNPNFNWDNIIYLNEENIPLMEFKEIMQGIIKDIR